ncbi:hypothetical protein [Pseudodesulfovibrio pelocollis]|uniref:hypothetical protein n=1 Tax=Pseudodesulfovibrio pelocollis TaxID=3051432 RepID=UPI00255B1A0D|nr:hypothetical protein [Pseudodesulfovibrio sp. SB368]
MFPSTNIVALLWWSAYTAAAIWLHRTVPGVDLLAPGIVLSLQEDGGRRTVWLGLAWMLIIEGTGNLPFGYGLAWYGVLVALFLLGRSVFEARSLVFMALLGLALGALHPVITHSLASLAELTVDGRRLLLEGALQAAFFPIVWVIADKCYPRMLRQDVKHL